MYDWTALSHTVKASLASGRVGQPLFVRWTAAAAGSSADLKTQLAQMCALSSSWLDADILRLYAAGAEEQGHLSLSLNFENGSSALLACALAHGRPAVNLVILGGRGAIYHTDGQTPHLAPTRGAPTDDDTDCRSSTDVQETLAAIDRSLAANRPVPLPAGGSLQ